MTDRVGTLKKNINYISPTYLRPTKEMLEKYENIWLPLREKLHMQKKQQKKIFLIYGDFDIIEVKNTVVFFGWCDKFNKSTGPFFLCLSFKTPYK